MAEHKSLVYARADNNPMIIDITLAQLPDICKQMAQNIEDMHFSPDVIIAVERAGRLLAFNLQEHLNVPMTSIYATRPGTNSKHKYSAILKFLPRGVRSCLRVLEAHSGFHKANSSREVRSPYPLSSVDSHVLLVDDSIDTGNTMQAVIDFLLELGFSRNRITTAVINTTLKNPLIKPDVFLLKNLCSFPWSADSSESEAFLQEYERVGRYITDGGK